MTSFQLALGALFLALILILGGVWVFQAYYVYRFDQTQLLPKDLGMTNIDVVTFVSEDGAVVQAWLALPAPGRPILFSFYGNFATIGPSMQRLSSLLSDGTGVVMLQYRGAGGMGGHPSEENFARDARALYDQLDVLTGQTIPQNRRILHGFSLGSGVAVRLASERPFAGLVLEAAIPRLCMYFQRRYYGFPFCRLMWAERYDSIDRIAAIAVSKLFVHGGKDVDVPLIWGKQLYDAALGPKRFVELANGHHTDLAGQGLIPAIQSFLRDRVD